MEEKNYINNDKSRDPLLNRPSGMFNQESHVSLDILRENCESGNPMSPTFSYAEAYNKLDMAELKHDLFSLMKDSKSWWPADYGTYGPLFIRMAWHSAGTYRTSDGRGGASRGTQRFAPLNSWPDNANLDKARRLLWPIKQKYGNKISWADLMILAGNCALESMGLTPIGFAGGREDVWETQKDVYWGREQKWLGNERSPEPGELENPLAATQMGLIYVNPEGPDGVPNPIASSKNIRLTFERMAMNDEETVALIAGGHTFGKCHGAAPTTYLGPAPEYAPLEEQQLGWKNSYGLGNAQDTITSGIEGAWKPNPIQWDMGYFTVLMKYQFELVKSPAGAYQWVAKNVDEEDMVIDAHLKGVKHPPIMTTADLALRYDHNYRQIAISYFRNPQLFTKNFADAWFKLTHRDMGPVTRYLGDDYPKKQFIWQDPIPKRTYGLIDRNDIVGLKKAISNTGLQTPQLIKTAWSAACTFRGSDRRGGANGGRLNLKPQNEWIVNEPDKLNIVLEHYKRIQQSFNQRNGRKQVSIADLIVLGGCVGIEKSALKTGNHIEVPFMPGRTDATQEDTDIKSFSVLEPVTDGFRNYVKQTINDSIEKRLINQAQLLKLTPPEMTVLLGGMRVLNVNYNQSPVGVLTDRKECLSNDFFVNLLDMNTVWEPDNSHKLFKGIDRISGKYKWTASRVDLLFGSNSELRALCEVYASKGNEDKFIHDFINVWVKVMNLDRFDIKKKS